jgi:hypothetical protein
MGGGVLSGIGGPKSSCVDKLSRRISDEAAAALMLSLSKHEGVRGAM